MLANPFSQSFRRLTVNVQVGALAGSTILLLTVPWFVSILAGRFATPLCDPPQELKAHSAGRVTLDAEGKGNYKGSPKLDPPGKLSLTETGINCNSIRATGALLVWSLHSCHGLKFDMASMPVCSLQS